MKKLIAALLLVCNFLYPITEIALAAKARSFSIEEFVPPKEDIPDELELEPYADSVYRVKGMYRLVEDYTIYPKEGMADRIQNFNSVLDTLDPHIPIYVYFVDNSRTHPIEKTFPEESEAYIYLKENLHADAFDHLKYSTFEQFCEYFYTTDHHWNYRGSYQGYLDVVRMLKGENEPVIEPTGVVVLPVKYDGSYANKAKKQFSEEDFTIYRFNRLPSYIAYMNNGNAKTYDHIQNYLNGKISEKPLVSHYALCYGGEYGKIVFENNKKTGKGTLLLFGDSMSNAVKPLLIEHYDRIVYIDLRRYNTSRGVNEPFHMKDITSKYKIDQILFLCNVTLFMKYTNYDFMNP